MENRERVSRERLRCNQSKTEKELTPGSPDLRQVGGGGEGGDSKDQPWVGPHDARQRFRLDYRDEEMVLAFITSIWDRGSEARHRGSVMMARNRFSITNDSHYQHLRD